MQIFVNDEIKQARSNICKDCEQLTFMNTCSICNCYMPAKVRLPAASCPDNKWFAVVENAALK